MSDQDGLYQPFSDDLSVREIPVTLGKKQFVLVEASEDARIQYRDALARATRLGPEGKPQSFDGIAKAESLLVQLCLFELYENKGETNRRPTLLSTVRAWPSRITKALFERAEKLSDLGQKHAKAELERQIEEAQRQLQELEEHGDEEERLKNSSSATADISA